ncbi:MAG: hypothetical protein NTY00_03160 [Deltaproteobacteria bacterium]|nr:hypothetical protein [Deltaproteobacteria bacterium]
MKCFYCLQDKPPNKYKKREHVIPQCLGRFSPDNLILYNCVCDECNQFFGDKLEIFLGRDSYESIERKKHGIEPKKPLKNKRRVKSKIIDGEWKGAIVEEAKADKPGEIGISYPIQAGFYNKFMNEYIYYEPKDIPSAEQLEKEGYDLKTAKMFADESELPQLIEILKNKGINISTKNDLIQPNPPVGSVLVESEVIIDRTIARALSKIAFNYLAYVAGSKIVLRDEFNGIRQFIRFDEGDLKKYFSVNVSPILHDNQKIQKFNTQITQGHLINVEWHKDAIVSKVSPFNSYTYAVLLCSNYNGIWYPIKSGHYFDLTTREVSKQILV